MRLLGDGWILAAELPVEVSQWTIVHDRAECDLDGVRVDAMPGRYLLPALRRHPDAKYRVYSG